MILECILKLNRFINAKGYKMYTQQEMLDKLNEVCKKYNLTSYELDIKLSQSLLNNFSIEEIRDKELIIVILNKLLAKK